MFIQVHAKLFTKNSFFSRNGRLRKKEFKSFRRKVKRLARNKLCARHIWQYCDMDSDGVLTRGEWSNCLGVNVNSKFNNIFKIDGSTMRWHIGMSSASGSDSPQFKPQLRLKIYKTTTDAESFFLLANHQEVITGNNDQPI